MSVGETCRCGHACHARVVPHIVRLHPLPHRVFSFQCTLLPVETVAKISHEKELQFNYSAKNSSSFHNILPPLRSHNAMRRDATFNGITASDILASVSGEDFLGRFAISRRFVTQKAATRLSASDLWRRQQRRFLSQREQSFVEHVVSR